MRLVHYSSKPISELHVVAQREYDLKPLGLWVSDDDCANNWFNWCVGEGFRLEALTHIHDVQLSAKADICVLGSAYDIRQFTTKFRTSEETKLSSWCLDWPRVRQFYDGLIITPYIWDCRLDLETIWYNTWDCASGCIWNPAAVASIQLRQVIEVPQPTNYHFDTCQNR
jgi:hypothetical protein